MASIAFPYRFTKRHCLAQLIEMRNSHQLNYEHWDTQGDDERAEYNSQMVNQMNYLIELVEADIADDDQLVEEAINE